MKPAIKRLLFNNPLQKLLALCFAITIWIFAPAPDQNNLTEIQFFVPVSYVNLPKNLEIISDPLQSVSVSVEIPSNEIQKAHPSLFQAVIDLEDAIPGDRTYGLNNDIIEVQKDTINVKITQVSPSSMDLIFEEVIQKTVPIKAVFVGEVSKGYVLEKVTMEPEFVTIRGPKSITEKIEQLETKAINIDKADSHIELLVQLSLAKGITVEPKQEWYISKIRIGSEPVDVRFLDIPIGIVNQTYVTRINPKRFNVLLRGPRSLMDTFNKKDIQAFIDLENLRPGKEYKIESPTLRIRPEIQIKEIWPKPISVWVKKQRID
ncbi:MAG: YbbR-like domain-containing protein [Deltaproteobacteria bacterium]|jgi:YbbR domain-containing protein|nr:YbbR-like domain-containing protein [Deltaproteobacteria bacterium]MBT4090940.1 YbbR-like domain-containing protein [Deltaproteobacteria bacterium]MBT4269126.1 YbbR-like domain-containing protein [Deltaproteobacteria bacterium]MBT4641301.1 YbbR-like domain-containing protein [Deltaproteobacteria bacterium]MBT6504271.1 YbbR-like domain-containing protein [Deltaproteobacteria bacterium]